MVLNSFNWLELRNGEAQHSVVNNSFGVRAQSCPTLCDLMDCTLRAPLSMGFPRQEYWSGLPFPPQGDLPDPGIEPESPAPAGRFFTTEQPGKPKCKVGIIVPWKSQKLNQGCWDKNKKTLDDMDVYGKQHLAFSSVLS